ncbi:Transcription factor like [Actinidia chinensis var. chinensis]|uniref:Transcription factor like n=1 Tax=Actinidia chinensis var. chinensis TaxID=1590841 RepID=A0A2R6R2R4_ACTCC|nr:Transcription factor like [Actinidia chinensis var. chinensis]
MSSTSTQFATSARMGMYDPIHQVSMWESMFRGDIIPNSDASVPVQIDASLGNKAEYASYDSLDPSENHPEANKMSEKVQRRLAQNREAARKSRLRKKAYVQQLETYRLKLAQLEQELTRARQQGVFIGGAIDTGHLGFSGPVNTGIATFEMEYAHWVEEQQRHNCELRKVLQAHISDIELRILVENGLNHYDNLFRMKAEAAKADAFYLISGTWRTSVEGFFLWLGGFRPSELLNVLMPQIEPLTDQQHMAVTNLRQSSQQAEDALSQGIDQLQQTLAQSIAADPTGLGNYGSPMASAIEKLDTLENFVSQADHLRQQTLHQLSRILTIRQTARGLLALGEYFQRLRALSLLWASRPREPAYNI